MFNKLILNYVKKITKEDIKSFSLKENIYLTNDEVDIIYYHIKNDYNDLLFSNGEKTFSKIKSRINPTSYEKLINLYNFYKLKYKNYL